MEEIDILKMDIAQAYDALCIVQMDKPEITPIISKITTGINHKFHIGYLIHPYLRKYVYVQGHNISINKEKDMKPTEYFEETQARLALAKKTLIEIQDSGEDVESRY